MYWIILLSQEGLRHVTPFIIICVGLLAMPCHTFHHHLCRPPVQPRKILDQHKQWIWWCGASYPVMAGGRLCDIEMGVVAGCWHRAADSRGAPIRLPHTVSPFLTTDLDTNCISFPQVGLLQGYHYCTSKNERWEGRTGSLLWLPPCLYNYMVTVVIGHKRMWLETSHQSLTSECLHSVNEIKDRACVLSFIG